MRSRDLVFGGVLLAIPLFALSCNGDEISGPTGSLAVITTTSGDRTDPDGYTVQVDDRQPQPIAPDATLETAGLAPGTHTITLAGLAADCSVSGNNPRTVALTGTRVSVAFEVICLSVHGALEISTLTTGESLDPDSFEVSIDNGAPRPIGTSASISLPAIAPGAHTVTLSNVASNCTLAEGSSQSASVSPGEPAAVRFTVTCSFIGITIWNTIPLPPLVTAVTHVLAGRTLWGTSPSDLFVIGQSSAPSPHYGIWHYDGSGWTEQVSRPDALNGLWGFSTADVYAVGNSGVILHYDGSDWADVPGPVAEGVVSFNGIWGAAAQDIFLSGNAYSGLPATELLAHFDGGTWTRMATPVFGDFTHLTQMAGTSGSDVWAIGRRRKCEDCNYSTAMVVHYDGQGWTEEIAANNDFYYGVWAIAPNDVWVVGENGWRNPYVLHFDGTGWAEEELNNSHLNVQDVWASSGSDVYAVGPALLHYDGTGWSTIPGVSGAKVWGISREDVFILQEHAVLHGSP